MHFKPTETFQYTFFFLPPTGVRRGLIENETLRLLRNNSSAKSLYTVLQHHPPEKRIAGIVYRVKCKDCNFSYIGESKCAQGFERSRHNPAHATSRESTIRQHAAKTIHPSTHAMAKFLKGMKQITSAEFFWSLYTQTLTRTLSMKKWSSQGHNYVLLLRSLGSRTGSSDFEFQIHCPLKKSQGYGSKFGKLFKFFR